jgi:hypothetical protein
MKKFQVNDRVRRLPYTITIAKDAGKSALPDGGEVATTVVSAKGCIGTIQALREETTNSNRESRERSIMVHVLWDNGTLSYHGPEALEQA